MNKFGIQPWGTMLSRRGNSTDASQTEAETTEDSSACDKFKSSRTVDDTDAESLSDRDETNDEFLNDSGEKIEYTEECIGEVADVPEVGIDEAIEVTCENSAVTKSNDSEDEEREKSPDCETSAVGRASESSSIGFRSFIGAMRLYRLGSGQNDTPKEFEMNREELHQSTQSLGANEVGLNGKMREEIISSQAHTIQSLTDENKELTRCNVILEQELENLRSQNLIIPILKKDVERISEEKSTLFRQRSYLETENENLSISLKDVTGLLQTLTKEVKYLSAQNDMLESKLEQVETERDKLQSNVSTMKEEKASLASNVQALTAQNTQLTAKLELLNAPNFVYRTSTTDSFFSFIYGAKGSKEISESSAKDENNKKMEESLKFLL